MPARTRFTRMHGRGIAVAAAVLVMALVHLLVLGSIKPAGEEAYAAVLSIETCRAFHAAQSGAVVALGQLNAGLPAPVGGDELAVGEATARFVAVPPPGQAGPLVVEGSAGIARRRIGIEIE